MFWDERLNSAHEKFSTWKSVLLMVQSARVGTGQIYCLGKYQC